MIFSALSIMAAIISLYAVMVAKSFTSSLLFALPSAIASSRISASFSRPVVSVSRQMIFDAFRLNLRRMPWQHNAPPGPPSFHPIGLYGKGLFLSLQTIFAGRFSQCPVIFPLNTRHSTPGGMPPIPPAALFQRWLHPGAGLPGLSWRE